MLLDEFPRVVQLDHCLAVDSGHAGDVLAHQIGRNLLSIADFPDALARCDCLEPFQVYREDVLLALAFVILVVFLSVLYPSAEFGNGDMLAAQDFLQVLELFLQVLHVVDVQLCKCDAQGGVAGEQEFRLFACDEFVDVLLDDGELALDRGKMLCLERFGNVLDSEYFHVLDEFVNSLVAKIFGFC